MVNVEIKTDGKTPKEMFADGVATMKEGVVETVRSEVRSAATASIIGAAWGLGLGLITGDKKLGEKIIKSAEKFARVGLIYGWEAAPSNHNATAKERGLPTVKWYDHLLSTLLAHRVVTRGNPFHKTHPAINVVASQLINPITFSGAKEVVRSALAAI